jgi:hypothetical protein
LSDNLRLSCHKTDFNATFPVGTREFRAPLEHLGRSQQGYRWEQAHELAPIASHVPDGTHPDSRTKRFSRWINNPEVDAEVYFLPFAEPLLRSLSIRPLALIMDGSTVGRGCLILMVSAVYQRRALPIAWLVVKGRKGHFPEDTLPTRVGFSIGQ